MLQIKCQKNASVPIISNQFYLDLYDLMKPDTTLYKPLVQLTSQLTGYTKRFVSSQDTAKKDRFIAVALVSTRGFVAEDLTSGIVFFGDKSFPLGFYDVTIYKNSSNVNLDPSGLSVIYNGLANAYGNSADASPVKYGEYTTNDSDTDTVYLTY